MQFILYKFITEQPHSFICKACLDPSAFHKTVHCQISKPFQISQYQVFVKCDRICEKGPHPAKLTFAVRSFVVGHVDLRQSFDFCTDSQYDLLTNLWPSFTAMQWSTTELRFRQTARATYR